MPLLISFEAELADIMNERIHRVLKGVPCQGALQPGWKPTSAARSILA